MFFTPKTKRQDTATTQYSSNISLGNHKYTARSYKQLTNTARSNKQFFTQSGLVNSGSNKDIQKIKPVAKLSIQIKKKKFNNFSQTIQSPVMRVSPQKYRPNIISKMSSKQHDNIIAYGVTTLKGYKNVINPHFVGINLGKVKNISLSQAFDGQFAAKIIKQQLNAQINQLYQQGEQNTQKMMSEIYNRLQQKIMKQQRQVQDNSGTSLLSIVINKQIITISNAGCSYAFCGTKYGSYLKLSESHTTQSKKQRQRVIKNGASIYQTVVNVPYQEDLKLEGPVRISPSGLMLTRCLGRAYDYKKQLDSLSHRCYNPEQLINITWKPQIKYIKTQQVVWLGIFSESIIKNCTFEYIKWVVNSQINKKDQHWTEHQISMQITRKIIQKLASQGVAQAMSAIFIILGPLPIQKKQFILKLTEKQKAQRNNRTLII